MLKLSLIYVRNILGIDELEIKAKDINIISGKNGQGKTSLIKSLLTVLKGGNEAKLIRNGASEGEVVLEFDDGTVFQKYLSGKGKLNISTTDGKIAKPQKFIDDLIDILSVNPIDFINADKKSRVNILLESLPMKVSKEELEKAIGDIPEISIDASGHALDAITKLHKAIYDQRTGTNRIYKDKIKAAEQLQESLIDIDMPDNIEDELSELRNIKQLMEDKRQQYFAEFEKEKSDRILESEKLYHSALREATEELEIAKRLFAEREKEISLKLLNEKREAEQVFTQKKEEKQAAFTEKYDPIAERITGLESNLKMSAVVRVTKDNINQYLDDASLYEKESEKLTSALNNLNELKANLLSKMPVKGLEIRDGELFWNGVPFDDGLNTAKQMEIAVKIGLLRQKTSDLKMICVDGIERLDSDNQAVLERLLTDNGIQAFLTKVADTPLNIETKTANSLPF